MFDESALDNLKKAYQAAPSKELAFILLQTLVRKNDLAGAGIYLQALAHSLDDEQIRELATHAPQTDGDEWLANLIDKDSPAQLITLARWRLKQGRTAEGKSLYLQALALQPELETRELNQDFALDAEQDLNAQQQDRRPLLKVVEKAKVHDLSEIIAYREKTTNFADVVGLEDVKKQVNKRIIMPFQKPSLFQKFRKKIGGGVLLYGPPGCGKTLIARATAGECNAQFYNVAISDVLDMYIGESENKLHAIFEKAREQTPSVIFFDEIEALAGKREHARDNSSAKLVSQFLSELDGFSQNNQGVLILASTNVPWAIDPAFLRPGRFDRMFFIPPPDKEARLEILQHHLKDRPIESHLNLEAIAAKTSGYSGADLANIIDMAADEAIDDSLASGEEKNINQQHLVQALSESRATTLEWLTTARNYARYANDGGRYDDVVAFLRKHGK